MSKHDMSILRLSSLCMHKRQELEIWDVPLAC
jgi:hypothetical protein